MNAAPRSWEDVQTIANSDSGTTAVWLRLGEHGSLALAGSGMVLSDGALLARKYVSETTQAKFSSLDRLGGLASAGALALSESFMIARYASGDVSSREFWTAQWVFSLTAAGGWVGGWLGGLAGTPGGGPGGATAGALLGSFAGTWAGQEIGKRSMASYYDWKFGKLDQEFGEFVYARYDIH